MQVTKDIIVDAVITWVDGNDPMHKAKMANYIENKTSLNSKFVRMRYDQVNEIEYAVKSILKYAKFVRNIFIITDNQTPDFLKDKEKAKKEYPSVFVIDHKTIFEGHHQYLPTFNSRSIETQIYKVPNLSERFIYFNDDFFLLKKINIEDFFIDGLPVLRGKWLKFDEDIFYKKIKFLFIKKKKGIGHKIAQQKAAKIIGLKKYFKFHHTPQPFRKSTFETYFKKNTLLETSNIEPRFRSESQFIPQSLANHLEIKTKTCILKNDYQLVYFQNYKKPFFWIKYKLMQSVKNENKLFLCMQSLDQCPEKKLSFIKKRLSDKYD